jgi:hypothetical protein
MLVFLHGGDPGDVVERHDFEAEVLIVADFLDFTEESGEIGCRNVVYVGQEVCWRELGRVMLAHVIIQYIVLESLLTYPVHVCR